VFTYAPDEQRSLAVKSKTNNYKYEYNEKETIHSAEGRDILAPTDGCPVDRIGDDTTYDGMGR
jgi:hypothetical protein